MQRAYAGADPQPPTRKPASEAELLPDLPTRRDVEAWQLGFDDTPHGGSVGAGLQLHALGPQNYVLDLNPTMTFFAQKYRRHTAFACEVFEDVFELKPGSTSPQLMELPRRGDLLGDISLEVRLPNLGIAGGTWVDAVGYVFWSRIRLLVGELLIHDHERLYYDMVDRLHLSEGRRRALDLMIGRGVALPTDESHVLTVPLKFFCCASHHATQQYLPIGALTTQTKVYLELTMEPVASLVNLPSGASLPASAAASALDVRVLSEQVYAAPEEQMALSLRPQELLVEVTQDMEALSYKLASAGIQQLDSCAVDLRELNLPTTSLMFAAYDETAAQARRYFDYLDCIASVSMLVQSNQRFAPRTAPYFWSVQPYQHCARCAAGELVGTYSFALDASRRQPSGALNFARLTNPTLRVDLQNVQDRPVKVKVFAQALNWLLLDGGSLAWRFST